MTNTPAIATTIEEVLEHLENIIHTSVSREDRIGFFAALYHKVTLKVKEDIDSGLFEDGSRLAYLDVLFANRYLHAAYEWQKDPESPLVSKSWKKAFQNLNSPRKLVLQHLLLGMNAHINLDLGIAVVEAVNNGSTIDDLRKDYNSINNILAGLTYGVINNLRMISPFLSIIGLKGSSSNSMLIQFSLSTARDGAWLFATDLIQKQPHEAEAFIAERDKSIEGLGQMLVTNKGFLRIGIFITYLFEWKKASRITTLLHTHKKLSMHELK
jgi:hypothetical protein